MPKRAIAFVATSKPAESRQFYSEVLGLSLLEETPFAIVLDAFGTQLRIQKASEVVVAPYTAFGIEVDDIEQEVRQLKQRGIELVVYPHFDQDELAIWTAPDGTKVAWFRDPDDNLLSLTQHTN